MTGRGPAQSPNLLRRSIHQLSGTCEGQQPMAGSLVGTVHTRGRAVDRLWGVHGRILALRNCIKNKNEKRDHTQRRRGFPRQTKGIGDAGEHACERGQPTQQRHSRRSNALVANAPRMLLLGCGHVQAKKGANVTQCFRGRGTSGMATASITLGAPLRARSLWQAGQGARQTCARPANSGHEGVTHTRAHWTQGTASTAATQNKPGKVFAAGARSR